MISRQKKTDPSLDCLDEGLGLWRDGCVVQIQMILFFVAFFASLVRTRGYDTCVLTCLIGICVA